VRTVCFFEADASGVGSAAGAQPVPAPHAGSQQPLPAPQAGSAPQPGSQQPLPASQPGSVQLEQQLCFRACFAFSAANMSRSG